jgi:hypothetical protein
MSAASEELRRLRTTPRDPRRDQEASRGCADDTPPAAASARERARFGRLASSNVRRTSIRCWRSALTRMAPAAIRTPAMTGRMRGMTYRPMSTSLEPSSGASSSCSGVWARHRPGWRASSVWSSGSGSAIGLWSTSEARLYDGGHAWRSTTTRCPSPKPRPTRSEAARSVQCVHWPKPRACLGDWANGILRPSAFARSTPGSSRGER